METGERLAAYLAGDLDADERAALEAELAGDPALRARLETIRRTDEALASLPPVEVPPDFSARLRAAVDEELEATAPADELTARREQRRLRLAWPRAVALATAAAAAVAVIAVGVGSLGGDDQDDAGGVALEAAPDVAPAPSPFIEVTDRDYSEDEVRALAARRAGDLPEAITAQDADALASQRAPAFGLGADTATAPLEADGGGQVGDEATTGGDDGGAESFSGGTGGEADRSVPGAAQQAPDDPLADVRRCVPQIVGSASEPVVPIYAEVARYEGEPAIVYLILTRTPGARLFDRLETWVVARNDCYPLLLTQSDR